MSGIGRAVDTAFTVGHSTHTAEGFVGLLRRRGIETLCDVRRYPASRRVPWTNAGELASILAERGIGYVHVPALGGRRRARPESQNGGWESAGFRGYADHMGTEEFGGGIGRLLDLVRTRPTAVVCAEAQWWRCHRRLLADALVVRGVRVLHIDARGGVEPHELTPFAAVEGKRVLYPPAQRTLDA